MTDKKTVSFFSSEKMFNLSGAELIKSLRDGVVVSLATGIYQAVMALNAYLEGGMLDFDIKGLLLAFCVGFLGAAANRFANIFRVNV